MSSFTTRPVGALVLHQKGEEEGRIGAYKRRVPFKKIEQLENLLIDNTLLSISADVTPIHPPFFTEFSYCDVFGGFLVATLSAEINYRLTETLGSEVSNAVIDPMMKDVRDKYIQPEPTDTTDYPKKVIFMCGTNLFMKTVDTGHLDELMASSDEWYLKPHPLTTEPHLKEYGFRYGYDRIINKDLSGHLVYSKAEEIASLNSSEITLRALLDNKPCIDLTVFAERYSHIYSPYIETARQRQLTQKEPVSEILKGMLSDPFSGFVHPSMSSEEVLLRLKNYQERALSLRETFRMKTNQRLAVHRKEQVIKKEVSK